VKVNVRLFAGLREAVGAREVTIEIPEDASVAELKARLGSAYPAVQPMLERAVCAIDDEYVATDERVREGAEVALIPPVSGGASLSKQPGLSRRAAGRG
jgi:molybdopterin synthase catalytic subunit